jgi:hypothetical protein
MHVARQRTQQDVLDHIELLVIGDAELAAQRQFQPRAVAGASAFEKVERRTAVTPDARVIAQEGAFVARQPLGARHAVRRPLAGLQQCVVVKLLAEARQQVIEKTVPPLQPRLAVRPGGVRRAPR